MERSRCWSGLAQCTSTWWLPGTRNHCHQHGGSRGCTVRGPCPKHRRNEARSPAAWLPPAQHPPAAVEICLKLSSAKLWPQDACCCRLNRSIPLGFTTCSSSGCWPGKPGRFVLTEEPASSSGKSNRSQRSGSNRQPPNSSQAGTQNRWHWPGVINTFPP